MICKTAAVRKPPTDGSLHIAPRQGDDPRRKTEEEIEDINRRNAMCNVCLNCTKPKCAGTRDCYARAARKERLKNAHCD